MALDKYRFVEEFPITKATYRIEMESPKTKATKNFGAVELHHIARCVWKEVVSEDGTKSLKLEKGELGGWIEKKSNLSQSGECWVHPNGIVCGDASVTGDAQVKGGEMGERALLRDSSVLDGDAVLKGNCTVFGASRVEGESEVSGNANVRGIVVGKSKVSGNAKVLAYQDGDATVRLGEAIGLSESDNYRSELLESQTIKDSTIDGDVQIRGYFNIDNSVVTDKSIVYGRYNGKVEYRGVKTIMYDGLVKDAAVKGNSYVQGVVVGPVTLEDVTSTGCVGQPHRVLEYLPSKVVSKKVKELKHLIDNYL